MRASTVGVVACFLALSLFAGNLPAQEKGDKADKAAIEKVVRAYLAYQGTPGKHDDLLNLCAEGATHSVHWLGEDKSSVKTLPEMVKWWKENTTVESEHVVDAVRVELHGADAGLAAAFVDFHTPNVKGRDVFTLMLVGEKWKVVSVVQQNRHPE